MAAIPTSPAVVFLEKDNSAYPPNIDSSIVGIVGYASKGPTNEATLITSQENLLKTFGSPDDSLVGQGLIGALEILETTNQIRYVRPIPSDAANASSTLSFGVCPGLKVAASGFGVSSNLYLRISVVDNNGVEVINNKLYSITSAIDGSSTGQASAIAGVIGKGLSIDDPLVTLFDSTDVSSGYIVAPFAGKNVTMTVSAFSSTTYTNANLVSAIYGIDASGNDFANPSSILTVSGFDITPSTLSYVVQSLYPGAGYNLGTIVNTGQTSGLSITIDSINSDYAYLNINNDGVNSETYKVSLVNNGNYIEDVINVGLDNAVSEYIKGEIYYQAAPASLSGRLTNLKDKLSNLGVGTTVISLKDRLGNITKEANPRFVKLIEVTNTALSGGSNGTMDTNTTLIGTAASKTGIYALDDDLLNISIALVPGISDQRTENALVTLAESCQNFLAVVSPPVGLSVQNAIDWMNGRSTTRTAAINSSWAAVMWPWVQVFNVFTGKDTWYDPAIFAVRQMTFTDNVGETWFAPAGFRRGRLTKPTATEKGLNQGDRDSLYVANINPIVNFAPEGITIFGQKTAQRAATALDRINIRRLMIYLRKTLLVTGRQDLFEPNDKFTWEIIQTKCEEFLSDIQARRGITDFKVICDESVNTPLRVDRNELWCKILLKPTKTAEWIVFEVNLTSQSAKFNG